VPLINFTKNGIYCEKAGIYIDPVRPVEKALITHGHSDHARPGHKNYLCTPTTNKIIKHRLGAKIQVESIDFGKTISMNGVKISFHPAGHVPGSAQIRLESEGEVAVVTGDFKTEFDGVSEAFEIVPCNTLVMESTFALPIYKWNPQSVIFSEMNEWWCNNKAAGKISIISAYALGKAQRILYNIDHSIGHIFTHGPIEKMNIVYKEVGIKLPQTQHLDTSSKEIKIPRNSLVLTTGSAANYSWINHIGNYSDAMASGWMAFRGMRKRREVDKGFVLSDHADWDGLNYVVKETGAETVYVTHGYVDQYARWLNEKGILGIPIKNYSGKPKPKSDTPKSNNNPV
jgi:putative mRNA 3-end processing factor